MEIFKLFVTFFLIFLTSEFVHLSDAVPLHNSIDEINFGKYVQYDSQVDVNLTLIKYVLNSLTALK